MAASNVPGPVEGNFGLNVAVIESIPQGLKVLRAEHYGFSSWSKTAKVTTETEEGNQVLFFLKIVENEIGKAQLEGEFTGMSELHRLMPTLVPKPCAWGELRGAETPAHFFLIEFKHFTGGMPDPVRLGKRLAELHDKSTSPTGMFGFPLMTFDGARTQAVDWNPSWTAFFSKLLSRAYEHDTEVNGRWEAFDEVFDRTRTHLIPRLVGTLEADGRSVKPCLIHGDLWEGNIGTDSETGDPWIFDAATYYGHNEMELGIWRAERHQLRANVYRNQYWRYVERSQPVDECDDRNRLYSVKTNLMCSACLPGHDSRHMAYNDLSYLINKYVPWVSESQTLEHVTSADKIDDPVSERSEHEASVRQHVASELPENAELRPLESSISVQ